MHYCPNQNLSNCFGQVLIFEQGGLFCVSPHRTYSCSWPPRPISRWSQNSHQVPCWSQIWHQGSCWSPFSTRDYHLLEWQARPPPYANPVFEVWKLLRRLNLFGQKQGSDILSRHGLGGELEGGRGVGLHQGRRQDPDLHPLRWLSDFQEKIKVWPSFNPWNPGS